MFHCLLACLFSWWDISYHLYVMCLFFLLAAFKIFSMTGFKQRDYHVPWCSFLRVSCAWGSLILLRICRCIGRGVWEMLAIIICTNNLNTYQHTMYTHRCIFFHCPKYPGFEAIQTRIIHQGNQKKLILLCDQRVNHVLSLGLNILLGKTRKLSSIIWPYDSIIIRCLVAFVLISFQRIVNCFLTSIFENLSPSLQ